VLFRLILDHGSQQILSLPLAGFEGEHIHELLDPGIVGTVFVDQSDHESFVLHPDRGLDVLTERSENLENRLLLSVSNIG
jgi:hypothetical protein